MFSVIIELSPLPLLKFVIILSMISKLMVACLHEKMVNTHNGRLGRELQREREPASTAMFGLSDHFNP
jgi:hypothetical protein